MTPANRPEDEEAVPLAKDIRHQGLSIIELHIDRDYVNCPIVDDVLAVAGEVYAKPWVQRAQRPGPFSKLDFKIDMRRETFTCPAGQAEDFDPGSTVEFDPDVCRAHKTRSNCTQAASGRGRTVSVAEDKRDRSSSGAYRKRSHVGPHWNDV